MQHCGIDIAKYNFQNQKPKGRSENQWREVKRLLTGVREILTLAVIEFQNESNLIILILQWEG